MSTGTGFPGKLTTVTVPRLPTEPLISTGTVFVVVTAGVITPGPPITVLFTFCILTGKHPSTSLAISVVATLL